MKEAGIECFPCGRQSALARLDEFVQTGVAAYARTRNFVRDGHRNVSRLSPSIRHRLISEEEVVNAVLAVHRFSSVEKFVQEVVWRTYWKGWLEQHPAVWADYLGHANAPDPTEAGDVFAGAPGLGDMSIFTRELRSTGYLHNHARMWWAGWWCHQQTLPWAVGARFFYDHLLDADAASNTLGWRWVAGLQTPGKAYLARCDNLAKYWEGHTVPEGVSNCGRATIPVETADRSRSPLPEYPEMFPELEGKVALLGHSDDLSMETTQLGKGRPVSVGLIEQFGSSDSDVKRAWRARAYGDAVSRWTGHYGVDVARLPRWSAVTEWVRQTGSGALVLMAPFAGPDADAWIPVRRQLRDVGIRVVECRRGWDTRFFPAARSGFFPFWQKTRSALVAMMRGDPVA